MLADSYKNAKILETFEKDGKSYAKIRMLCDRCSGSGIFAVGVHNGYLVPAKPDNGRCYKCGGSGYIIENVRDYTEAEYERMQRAKEKQAAARHAEAERKAAERLERNNKYTLNSHGFNDIYAYAIVGNTYDMKDKLKEHGAKFSYELLWVCPEEPTWLPADRYVRICVSDVFEFVDGALLVKENAKDFIQSLQPTVGSFIGSVGQRITVDVTVKKRLEFDRCYGYSYRTVTTYKYIMQTPDGNTVVWSTGSVHWDEGHTCHLTGTVKEHAKYNGTCQTVLTRCKEVTT